MLMTKKFWLHTGERALKSFAQTAASLVTANGLHLLNADWLDILSVSGMAAVASLLTSIASIPIGDDSTPSVVK